MKIPYKILGIAFLSFCISRNEMSAQYSEAGFGVGFATYWGDLNGPIVTTNFINNSGFALQLNARKVYSRRYGLHGMLSYGMVQGNDVHASNPIQLIRNLSFKSPVLDLSLTGEYYIFPFEPDESSSLFYPYVAAGISGFYFDPRADLDGMSYRLQPLGTEGQGMAGFDPKYSLLNWALSFGGGAKISITKGLNLGMEVIMRRTFTDYLDDVSSIYVNYFELEAANGPVSARLANRMNEYLGENEPVLLTTGTQRGGKKVKDYYLFSTISLNFMLQDFEGKPTRGKSGSLKCPKF